MNNVIDYLRETVKKYPDKIAFTDKNSQITFYELEKKADAIATEIIKKTNGTVNKPIAICLPKSVEMVVAFFAVAISGNFYSPIDLKMPQSRVNTIINVLEPIAVIEDNISGIDCKIKIQYSQSLLSDINRELINQQREKVLSVDPLYVLFTSGSTGTPKGVVISHESVIDYITWLIETFDFSDETVFGNQAPFYFDNSVLDIYTTIFTGARTVIIDEKLFSFQNQLFDVLIEKKVNTIFWVPSALIGIANSDILNKRNDLPKLKKILFAGEVMPAKQLRVWMRYFSNTLFANLYGPTEITVDCTYFIVDREYGDDEIIPIGKACRNSEIMLLNEMGKVVSGGEQGEICVRGVGLSKGYYNNVEKTKDVFIQNPMHSNYMDYIYKTGDLAKYDSDNNLIYIGRIDNQVKVQGHRIELGEIETITNSIENVKRSCALLTSNQQLCLVIEVDDVVEKKRIYKELKGKLPRYMLPTDIKQCLELPLNSNGKIDRVLLRSEINEENFDRFID